MAQSSPGEAASVTNEPAPAAVAQTATDDQTPLTDRERALLDRIRSLEERLSAVESKVSAASAPAPASDVPPALAVVANTAPQASQAPGNESQAKDQPNTYENWKKASSPETWGGLDPGNGFQVAKTKLGSLNISGYILLRYLNQLPAHQTFVDHLGNVQAVNPRNDIHAHRIILYFKGFLFNPRFTYVAFVGPVALMVTTNGMKNWQHASASPMRIPVKIALTKSTTTVRTMSRSGWRTALCFLPRVRWLQELTVQKADYYLLAEDAGFKYRGFFLMGEGYSRLLDRFQADGPLPMATIRDHGFFVQAAQMVWPKRVEVYGATSYVYGDTRFGFGQSHEFLGGTNYYPVDSRNLRFNLQVIRVQRSPVSSVFGYYTAGQRGTIISLATSLLF